MPRSSAWLAIWADGPAHAILAAEGLAPVRLARQEARARIGSVFDAWLPDVVVVGNSCGPSLEDVFVEAARRRGIPSVGVLNTWLLYDQKFADGADLWAYMPDQLVVMDELSKEEMVKLGAPAERLLPLGQPQFDELHHRRASFTEADKRAVRATLGAAPAERLVLFLSQDMENFYGGAEAVLAELGFSEYMVFDLLKESLRRLAHRRRDVVRLAVKLHPRETASKYASSGIPVVKEADAYRLMMSADLVVGMDTILLIEAGVLGCPTLSVQPHRKGVDSLVTNRLGLGRFCYDPNALDAHLDALLYDPSHREAAIRDMQRFTPRTGATQRVTELTQRHLLVQEAC